MAQVGAVDFFDGPWIRTVRVWLKYGWICSSAYAVLASWKQPTVLSSRGRDGWMAVNGIPPKRPQRFVVMKMRAGMRKCIFDDANGGFRVDEGSSLDSKSMRLNSNPRAIE